MSTSLKVITSQIPMGVFHILNVIVEGDLQFGQETDLKKIVLDRVQEETKGVLMNLQNVHVIDSSGIGILAALNQRLVAKFAPMILVGLTPHIQDILELGGMFDFFNVREQPEDAIKYIQARLSRR